MLISYNNNKNCKTYKKYFDKCFESAIRFLNLPTDELEINFAFVSKSQIKQINNIYRHVDKVTDVLSFPTLLALNKTNMQLINKALLKENFENDINNDTDNIVLGDICICYDVAKKQAQDYAHSIEREVCYLFIHGILHLLGYDHMIEDEKKIMRNAEENIYNLAFEEM